ncbi:hypothetical protein R3W88_000166 [Solanum pinnatisectum]|uniref:Uncharacterized protein n=1 Tax=Solanum pinnatisectum TaxID=50273 RepID=A0AAV9MH85_9SOLN|nr:hypothetical protein R3W88_000166 [Solanum pinnatisectum]
MEPFQDPSVLDHFWRKLGSDNAGVNCSAKIWYFWRSDYMWNKYCKKLHPVMVHSALYFTEGEHAQEEEVEVKNFVINGGWNEQKLKAVISDEMVHHIIMNIRPPGTEAILDKAWRVQSSKGDFTVKSTFHILRRKKAEKDWTTDDNLKRMRVQVASKCYCCEKGEIETMSHLLLTFASCVGININGLNLKQLIYRWWEHKMSTKLDQILKAIPAIIMWELWKRRNAKRHKKEISYQYIKGNPGQSAYEFCLRDSSGDLIYAEA